MTDQTVAKTILLGAASVALAAVLAAMPVHADEMTDKAVNVVAMIVVYKAECPNVSEDVIEQLRSVARLHMDAAGVDASDRKFVALTTLKIIELKQEAKHTRNFCKTMADAYEKGRTEE